MTSDFDPSVFTTHARTRRVIIDHQTRTLTLLGAADDHSERGDVDAALTSTNSTTPSYPWGCGVGDTTLVDHIVSGQTWQMTWLAREGGLDYWEATPTLVTARRLAHLERLELFIENAADPIYIQDMDGNVLWTNSAAAKSLGYTRDELTRMQIHQIELTVKPGSNRGIWNRMTPNKPILITGRHRRANGTTFPVEVRLALITAAHGESLAIALCRDISLRRYNEDHLESLNEQLKLSHEQSIAASKAKSAFLANMSHELRTPLNAIKGYSELVLEELEHHPDLCGSSSDLGKVITASDHLLDIINDLLDLSKIEAGKMEIDSSTFSLGGLVEQVTSTLHPLMEKSNNTFILDIEEDISMHSDARKLKQTLFNLLSNASKFTQNGTITLSARAIELEHTEIVELCVSDTGMGIAADQLVTIFSPFDQARSSDASKGTGLGLPISQRFCQLMGGQIEVSSEVGVGTTFTITLPVTATTYSEDPATTLAPQGPPLLALTGDESFVRLLAATLRSQRKELVHTQDLRIARSELGASPPDQLIVDLTEHTSDKLSLMQDVFSSQPTLTTRTTAIARLAYDPRTLRITADALLMCPCPPAAIDHALRAVEISPGDAIYTHDLHEEFVDVLDCMHTGPRLRVNDSADFDGASALIAGLSLDSFEELVRWTELEARAQAKNLKTILVLRPCEPSAARDAMLRATALHGSRMADVLDQIGVRR